MKRRDFVQMVGVAAVGTTIPLRHDDDFVVEVPFKKPDPPVYGPVTRTMV